MRIIYRISDVGYNKVKPDYINNENCLANAAKVFDNAIWSIIADNISPGTNDMIQKYLTRNCILYVEKGNGAATFNLALDEALTYDDPDKYITPEDGGNPYCQGGAEDTRVYLTDSCHWKITNSTTMTFAAKVKTLKIVEPTLRAYTTGTYPQDFKMFLDLRKQGHLLVTPLPGYSTHGETAWLTPLTDWEKHIK